MKLDRFFRALWSQGLITPSLILITVIGSQEGKSAPVAVDKPLKSLFSLTETAPPSADHSAIRLIGARSANPTPESWFDLRGSGDVWGWTGVMMTRNVSQASVTPFLPEPRNATGAAIVVVPGGGTVELSMDTQGYRVARWLSERGIAAFVLKYRLVPTPANPDEFVKMLRRLSPPYEGPPAISEQQARAEATATLQDGLEAIRYIRTHSSTWRISPNRIGIMGFSAGAYTSLNVALRSSPDSRPDLVAAIYGVMPDGATVTANAPPAFIAAASDDPQVPSMQSIRTYSAWRRATIPVELHLFQNGGHGFAVDPRGKSTDQWLKLFDHFLCVQGFESSHCLSPTKPN